jgi:type IV secretion system protein VirB1
MMIVLFDPDPVHSSNIDDAELPGVVVELDHETAEREGAFEETALSAEEAWEANADLASPTVGDDHAPYGA